MLGLKNGEKNRSELHESKKNRKSRNISPKSKANRISIILLHYLVFFSFSNTLNLIITNKLWETKEFIICDFFSNYSILKTSKENYSSYDAYHYAYVHEYCREPEAIWRESRKKRWESNQAKFKNELYSTLLKKLNDIIFLKFDLENDINYR